MPVRDAVDPGITYDMSFSEWEAGTAAGLDMWKWEQGEYPVRFKARVMAWHNLHNQVRIHSEDAVNRKYKKKGKR